MDQTIADASVTRLAAKTSKLPAGDPRGHDVVLGSLIDRAPAERIDVLIVVTRQQGRQGSGRGDQGHHRRSARYPGYEIYGEESFGPVKPIIRVNGDEEGYPDRQRHRIWAFRRGVQPGHQARHGGGPQDRKRYLPHRRADRRRRSSAFGGTKASGYGRFGGKAVIDKFMELRWITSEGPQSVLDCHIEGIERWIVKEPT